MQLFTGELSGISTNIARQDKLEDFVAGLGCPNTNPAELLVMLLSRVFSLDEIKDCVDDVLPFNYHDGTVNRALHHTGTHAIARDILDLLKQN